MYTLREIDKDFPPLGKPVLCWFAERKEWHIDTPRQYGPNDGNRLCFFNNYRHNYTHWTHLPDPPK